MNTLSINSRRFAGALLMTVGALSAVQAQEASVLAKIKASQSISIGHRDAGIPLSYLDEKGQPIGYTVDICLLVVDALKKELNMPSLKVQYVQVTGTSRIPLTANGTVDMECGTTTNTAERQQQVAFAYTTFLSAARYAYKKSENFSTPGSLKGKNVAVPSGTTTLRILRDLDTSRSLGLNVIATKDMAEGFLLLQNDRVSAFFLDDVLLSSAISSSVDPSRYAVSSEALSVEPAAIMVRKNDPQFLNAVNKALIQIFESGQINTIYAKWFLKPIPPRNATLNLPMSPELVQAIKVPTNSAEPSAYASKAKP
jgi:glutamate/aspartate transport system substrate-binding protein